MAYGVTKNSREALIKAKNSLSRMNDVQIDETRFFIHNYFMPYARYRYEMDIIMIVVLLCCYRLRCLHRLTSRSY